MARRGRKRAIAESPLKPDPHSDAQQQFKRRQRAFNNREVEHRIAAIEAIRVAETESLLSRLRLLRSYFTKEQLEAPAIAFFEQNLQNLLVIKNEKHKVYELEWKRNDGGLPDTFAGGTTANVLLGSVATGGAVDSIQFSVDSVRQNLIDAVNLHLPDSVMDEPCENLMPGNSFQTPGVDTHRLSFGMTPKTLRLPKNGEMLLSVHGSPLGVYKEENLEAIHESDDSSQLDGS